MPRVASSDTLDRLYALIQERADLRPQKSYVVELLNGGIDAIGKKVLEESAELVEAASQPDRAHVAHEAADLIFHAWVLLAAAGVEPAQVYEVLDRRFGTSGLAEKAARKRD
jgi:phosphoribosyl-ATP pyrophosphohydrolase